MTSPGPTTQPFGHCAQCGADLSPVHRVTICPDCPGLFCGRVCADPHVCLSRKATQPKPGDRVLVAAEVANGCDDDGRPLVRVCINATGGSLTDDTGVWPRLTEVRWRPDVPDRDGHAAEQPVSSDVEQPGWRDSPHGIELRNLHRQLFGRGIHADGDSSTSDLALRAIDDLRAERDRLAGQLAAAQAEVERLTRLLEDSESRDAVALAGLRRVAGAVASSLADMAMVGGTPANLTVRADRLAVKLRKAVDASAATAPAQTPQPPTGETIGWEVVTWQEEEGFWLADWDAVTHPTREAAHTECVKARERGYAARVARLVADDPPEGPASPPQSPCICPDDKAWIAAWCPQHGQTAPETAPAASQADDPAPVVAEDVHDTPAHAQGNVGRTPMVFRAGGARGSLVEAMQACQEAVAASGWQPALSDYRQGRADAAKALRHAEADMPLFGGEGENSSRQRIVDWAAEVAEQGEVPA